MILEIALALLLGLLAGTITGLIPGIHINLVAVFLVASSAVLLTFSSPLALAVFIVAMSLTHTFMDFIPSIFLGAPNEDTFLSILPGHSLLQEGKGYHALVYTLYGSLASLIIILIFTPLFLFFLPSVYNFFTPVIFFLLFLTSFFLLVTEKNGIIKAILIFVLAGFFGIATLNNDLGDPLLPLLTGLFGGSSLFLSIKNKVILPQQHLSKLKEITLERKELGRSFLASFIAAPLCSFLPSLGSGQAAILGSSLIDDMSRKEFLFLQGAINTVIMALSFVTLFAIQKSRTGSAAAIEKLLDLSLNDLLVLLLAIGITSLLAFFLTLQTGKIAAKSISKIPYTQLSLIILIFLVSIVYGFSGITGLLVFITGTALGITTSLFNIKKVYLMGCLIIPTMIWYWPF